MPLPSTHQPCLVLGITYHRPALAHLYSPSNAVKLAESQGVGCRRVPEFCAVQWLDTLNLAVDGNCQNEVRRGVSSRRGEELSPTDVDGDMGFMPQHPCHCIHA